MFKIKLCLLEKHITSNYDWLSLHFGTYTLYTLLLKILVSLYLHVVTGEDSLSAISLSFKPVSVYLTKEIQDVTFLERKFPKIESKSIITWKSTRLTTRGKRTTNDFPLLSNVQGMTIFKAKLFAFINQMDIYPYEVNSPDASRETLKSYQHSICTSCKFYTQKNWRLQRS